VGSIVIAWFSNHIARLANDLSLITSKFDLQIVSSYFHTVSLVSTAHTYQFASPLQASMPKDFAFSNARLPAVSDA
jgi:hypothetical protein